MSDNILGSFRLGYQNQNTVDEIKPEKCYGSTKTKHNKNNIPA